MRRILALMMSLIVVVSIVSCKKKTPIDDESSSPTEAVTSETTANTTTNASAVTDAVTNAITATPNGGSTQVPNTLIDWMKNGKFYIRYTMETEYEGVKTTSRGTMAYDNDNYITVTEAVVDGVEMKSRVLVRGGISYMIDEINRTYYESTSTVSDITQYDTMQYVGKGTGAVNGKNLSYDEYKDEEKTVYYYFENDKVYALKMLSSSGTVLMIIEEASSTLPSGIFDVPAGYTKLG